MNLLTALTLGSIRDNNDNTSPLDFIGYGQSNWLFHMTNGTGAPAAHPDTFVWDPGTSTFVAPSGNGVRRFLNAMQAATGRVCRLVSGGQGGVNIAALQKGAGTGYYEALLARVVASGINPTHIIFHQGEGDANSEAPTALAYQNAMNTLHSSIATDTGKSLSQLPFVISSIGFIADGGGTGGFPFSEQSWHTIKSAQATVNAVYPNIHYSHSNMDAILIDGVHWDGPSYGRSGERYAQTVKFLMGLATTRARFFATTASRLTTTTTQVDLVHSMGTDFTPATGITGFEVSNDNGGTWVSATGARLDADSVTLTHVALGTTERLIRYQFGKDPDVSSSVFDNGTLTVPLNYTPSNLVATGEVSLPTLTYATSQNATSGGTTQNFASMTVPGGSEELLAILGVTSQSGSLPATFNITAQPSGTVIAATAVNAHSSTSANPAGRIYQAILPSGTTTITAALGFASDPFGVSRIHVATVPTSRLNSTTAVASGTTRATATNTATVDIATSDGGILFAIGGHRTTTGTGAFSGDETITTRNSAVSSGAVHAVGDASNVSANALNTVTATFTGGSFDTRVTAATWR